MVVALGERMGGLMTMRRCSVSAGVGAAEASRVADRAERSVKSCSVQNMLRRLWSLEDCELQRQEASPASQSLYVAR